MLDALRRSSGSWLAKIFIGLLVMSFAIWGVSDIFNGFGHNVAAKVGDTEISIYSFDRAYRQDLNNLGHQIGRPLSTTEGAQFGIPQQTLGRLVAEAAMNEKANQLNLGISDQQLASLIQAEPAFQRPGGGYDRAQLALSLRNAGITEDEYVIERRQLAERQQIAEGISGAMAAPVAYLEALYAYQAETRDISYIVVDDNLLDPIDDPSTAQLEEFFNSEKQAFRAPEYRKVALLELSPTKLARLQDVSDETVSAEYERDKDRYSRAERRNVRQISFTSSQDAQAAAQKIESGASFDDLMGDLSLTANDVNLGLMTQTDFLDPAIGEAAFSLSEGETSGVVDGRFSLVILNVTAIEPESVSPYLEVADEIRQTLATEQAQREVLDLLDEIEDARAGGATLSEVAERFSLDLQMPIAFDSRGRDQSDNLLSLPEAPSLVSDVFASDVGVENDPLQLGDRGFLWFEITDVLPPRDRDLSEVSDQVASAWIEAETGKRLEAFSQSLLEKLNAGTPLSVLADQAGTEAKFAASVTRNETHADLGRQAVSAAFEGPAGTTADIANPTGSARIVLKVDTINTPAFFAEAQDAVQLRQQLSQQLQDSLLNQFVTEIEQTSGVEVNERAIAQIIGLTANH